jgi:hypothetical protein
MGMKGMLFLVKMKYSWWQRKAHRDARASSFVVKVQSEVFAHFHTVAVRYHKGMPN